MTTPERILRVLLRVYAVMTMAAVFAVFLPHSWMAIIHEWLGLGELPDAPIVDYLARSLSAFYAMFGVLLWVISCDVRRYRPIIAYTVWAGIVFGVVITIVDARLDFPLIVTIGEGPSIIVFALVTLAFLSRVERGDRDR